MSEPIVSKQEPGDPNVKSAYRALVEAVLSQANRNAWRVKDLCGIAFFDPRRDTRIQSVPEFDTVVARIGGLPLVAARFGTDQASRLALQLVYEYFRHLDALRLDEEAIERIWGAFISELEDSNWTTSGVANLRNFNSDVYPIDLGDGVSLRGRNVEELESMGFSEGPVEGIAADWSGFGASSFVLVAEHLTAKQPDNFIMLDSVSVWTKAQRALGSLRLLASGDLGLSPMWIVRSARFNVGMGGTTRIGAAIPGAAGSQYVWSADIGSAYPSVYSELAKLEHDGYGRSPGNLDLALRSFMATYDSWPPFPDSKLLASITALEAILGSGSELAFRLSFRVAGLLASGDAERSGVLEALRDFYGTRSAIVHGGRLGEKHQIRLGRVDELRSLVRRLLRSFVGFAAATGDDVYNKAFFKEHLDAALVDNAQREKLRRALGLVK